MTISTKVAAVLAEIRSRVESIHSTARLGYQTGPYAYAGEDMGQYLRDAVDDCEEIVRSIGKLESALTKAEAVAWEIRGKAGKPWLRCTEEVYHDHVRRVGQEHARALYAHAPPADLKNTRLYHAANMMMLVVGVDGEIPSDAPQCTEMMAALAEIDGGRYQPAVPVESRYECRECRECGHAGINDANLTQGACFICEWSGPEPEEDKCPGCGDEGCMTAACPKCGARYRFIAELEPAMLPAESPASVPDGCHVVRYNDDGEFGQKVGWLYRTGGDPCVISGKPVYVWRPIAELLETPA